MTQRLGDIQTLGWWITEPDFPVVGDVRLSIVYDNGAMIGTYTAGSGLAAPVITTNAGASFSQATVPVALAGTCSATCTIIYVNGATTGVTYTAGATTWSYAGNLQLGANLFYVSAYDGSQESPPDRITVTCTAATSTLSIEQALYSILTNSATVTALVGTRIYPQDAPQGTAVMGQNWQDFITYNRISGIHEQHMAGESGMEHPRIQFDIWAQKMSNLWAIKEALRLVLDRYTGTVTVSGASKVIRHIFLEDDFSDFSAPANASEQGIRRGIMDFTVWAEEVTM